MALCARAPARKASCQRTGYALAVDGLPVTAPTAEKSTSPLCLEWLHRYTTTAVLAVIKQRYLNNHVLT